MICHVEVGVMKHGGEERDSRHDNERSKGAQTVLGYNGG